MAKNTYWKIIINIIYINFFICITTDKKFISAPKSTAHGSLHKHITKNANINTFQPMNINFGIIDSFNENIKVKGRERKVLKTRKAIKDFKNWIKKQTN